MSFRKTKRSTDWRVVLDPFVDPTSIGNVLMKLGKITREQWREAVGRKAQFDEHLLGALLKDMGLVGDHDLALALKVQAEMRHGDELTAELDVLQSKMDEASEGARELQGQIAHVRMRRRDRGEPSGIFLIPTPSRARS